MQTPVLDPVATEAVHIRVYTHMYGPNHPGMHTLMWTGMFTLGTLVQFDPNVPIPYSQIVSRFPCSHV